MKKMFFTAVALVAFSATSMANTVEVKEVVIEETKKEVVLKATPCQQMMMDTYELIMDIRDNGVEDIKLLNHLLSQCK